MTLECRYKLWQHSLTAIEVSFTIVICLKHKPLNVIYAECIGTFVVPVHMETVSVQHHQLLRFR
jgi:hypothetical protein